MESVLALCLTITTACLILMGIVTIRYDARHRKEIGALLDALAKGSAPQGARQQGRDTTQAKVIQDQQKPKGQHFHRGTIKGIGYAPFLVQNCGFTEVGAGPYCLHRDNDMSYGDDWGIIEARDSRRQRPSNHRALS